MNSILDNDLYKFSMAQVVLHHFPSVVAEYKFICRTKGVNLLPLRSKIELAIEQLCNLRTTEAELNYLRTIRFLKKDFIAFLEDFTLKRRYIHLAEEDGELSLTIKGPWIQTIFFEVPLLAIISEVYANSITTKEKAEAEGHKRLSDKITFFKERGSPFIFTDFGTRRRFSLAWQEEVVTTLKRELPSNFIGTSNVYLAMKHKLRPIGTMAHEFIQAGQGLQTVQLAKSQKYMLDKWSEEYRGDLGIALTDTVGMKAFLNDFDLFFAKLYDGCRHDSGDPYHWGDALIEHYKKFGIDPMTKVAVFSDGLNFESADQIASYFKNKIKVSFGIGTNLTHDMGHSPLSIVIKLVRINDHPVAKISDEPNKAICTDPEFLSYLKKVFQIN